MSTLPLRWTQSGLRSLHGSAEAVATALARPSTPEVAAAEALVVQVAAGLARELVGPHLTPLARQPVLLPRRTSPLPSGGRA